MSLLLQLKKFSDDTRVDSLTPAVVDEAYELLQRRDFDELYSLIGRVVAKAPDHVRDELFEAISSALADEELDSDVASITDVCGSTMPIDFYDTRRNSAIDDEMLSLALLNEIPMDSSRTGAQRQPLQANIATQYEPITPPLANLRSPSRLPAFSDKDDDSDDEELFEAVRELVHKNSQSQEDIQSLRASLATLRTQAAAAKSEWEKAASNVIRETRARQAELLLARRELTHAIDAQNAIVLPEPILTLPGFVQDNSRLSSEGHLVRLSCFFPHFRRTFGDPYFSAAPVNNAESGEMPAPNDDAVARAQSGAPSRSMLVEAGSSYRKWREREREVLGESVLQVALQLRRASDREFSRSINSSELAEMTRSWSLREWGAVRVRCANRNVSLLCRRSPSDIMCRYLNVEAPWAANRMLPWTANEDERLLGAVEMIRNARGWADVAAKVNERRTPMSCLRRLTILEMSHVLRGTWNNEEDSILVRAVATFGRGNWKHIALVVGMRDAQQCMNRYEKRLSPGRRIGKWSDNEVRALLDGVRQYGENWVMVATSVDGRSDVQCREKYMNSLTACALRAQWKWKEDALLVVLVHTFGTKWSSISRYFVSRSGSQCMRRWKRMQKYIVDMRSSRGIITGKRRIWPQLMKGSNKRRVLTMSETNINQNA